MTIPAIETKSIGQTLMKRLPCASIIVENTEGEVLLLLRNNKSTILYPNHWTLVGGKVEDRETQHLKIGYGFKSLFKEYFLSRTGSSDVHHS